MGLEKCPSCGGYTLDLDQVNKVLKCYSGGCGYSEPVDVEKYLDIHNELPLLAAPIETEEVTKTIEELTTSGTFQTARELERSLKDDVERTLRARRKKAEREIYEIDRTIKLIQ